MRERQSNWEWEIKPQTTWLGVSFRELYSYKDLLFRLVRKEFLMYYHQTLLGPFWLLLQPILTVFTYVLIFNKVIRLPTDGIPPFLFYLSGITLWNLFSDIFLGTSTTFAQNAHIFSKVYFPRIIAPLSIVLVQCARFLIQLLLLITVLLFYYFTGKIELHFTTYLLFIPAVIITAGIALGAGLIFSIITAVYRDLLNMMQLIIRLMMFICPIFYSLSIVPDKIKWLVNLNPLSSQFELFRYAFLGKGQFSFIELGYSVLVMLFLVTGGILFYNKMGDKIMDVV